MQTNTYKDNNFHLAISSEAKTLSSLQMHAPAAQTKSVLAGTAIQAPQRNSRQQSPSFTLLLLPIHESKTSRLVWGTVLVCDCVVSLIIPPYFQKPNPQWVTWSSFRIFVMWNIPGHCSQRGWELKTFFSFWKWWKIQPLQCENYLIMKDNTQIWNVYVLACVFGVFRALLILNGYC